jgi:beta-carotene hydroxylase
MTAKNLQRKRPPLSESYYYPSAFRSTLLVLYAFSLFALPSVLARIILSIGLSWPLTVLLIAPCVWLAGQGLLLIGWVGHEGAAHFSLYRNKWLSILAGIFVSSAIPTFLELGFAVGHRNHHRFTNQASDPDCQLFGSFKSFWSKTLLARPAADSRYFLNTLMMAFNQPLPYRYIFPFNGTSLVALAWFNLGCSLLWLTAYALITLYDPLTGIVCIILPSLVTFIISSLQPYLEHAGTEIGIGRDARSRIAPLFTLLYAGNNYHLEHHIYPGVPCYRLPSVHRMLVAQGFYKQVDAFIEPGIWRVYSQGIALQYPHVGQKDSDYDPLIPDSPII